MIPFLVSVSGESLCVSDFSSSETLFIWIGESFSVEMIIGRSVRRFWSVDCTVVSSVSYFFLFFFLPKSFYFATAYKSSYVFLNIIGDLYLPLHLPLRYLQITYSRIHKFLVTNTSTKKPIITIMKTLYANTFSNVNIEYAHNPIEINIGGSKKMIR